MEGAAKEGYEVNFRTYHSKGNLLRHTFGLFLVNDGTEQQIALNAIWEQMKCKQCN